MKKIPILLVLPKTNLLIIMAAYSCQHQYIKPAGGILSVWLPQQRTLLICWVHCTLHMHLEHSMTESGLFLSYVLWSKWIRPLTVNSYYHLIIITDILINVLFSGFGSPSHISLMDNVNFSQTQQKLVCEKCTVEGNESNSICVHVCLLVCLCMHISSSWVDSVSCSLLTLALFTA